MATDSLSTYRDNLHHVVRPEDPRARPDAPHIMVEDYEALALRRLLIEYEAYGAGTQEERDIAAAYKEYIEYVVYQEQKETFRLYAHTEAARVVLHDTLNVQMFIPASIREELVQAVYGLMTDQLDELAEE